MAKTPKKSVGSKAGKQSAAGGAGVSPVDTAGAAKTAAAMLAARNALKSGGKGGSAGASGGSTIEQIKSSLKPSAGAMGTGGAAAANKPAFGHDQHNQVARNQVFGAGASKINVPRRTGG